MLGWLAFTLITDGENLWFFRVTAICASARAGVARTSREKARKFDKGFHFALTRLGLIG